MKNNFDIKYLNKLCHDDGCKRTVDWVKELGDYPITRQMNHFRDKVAMLDEMDDNHRLARMLLLYNACWLQIIEGYKDFSYDAYIGWLFHI